MAVKFHDKTLMSDEYKPESATETEGNTIKIFVFINI